VPAGRSNHALIRYQGSSMIWQPMTFMYTRRSAGVHVARFLSIAVGRSPNQLSSSCMCLALLATVAASQLCCILEYAPVLSPCTWCTMIQQTVSITNGPSLGKEDRRTSVCECVHKVIAGILLCTFLSVSPSNFPSHSMCQSLQFV